MLTLSLLLSPIIDREVIVGAGGIAMVIHSEMALWQLWSSFDSSNCSPSMVKMGLSLALSYSKKHLVGMLMIKIAKAKGRLLQDKL